MAIDDLRLRVLPHRNRLELRIGRAYAELCQDEVRELLRQLTSKAATIGWAACEARQDGMTGAATPTRRVRMAEQLYRHLVAVADAGEPCPSNRAIGEMLEVTEKTASRMLADMEEVGRIRVDRTRAVRVVTILATGARTLQPESAPPCPVRRPTMAHVPALAGMAAAL
ncbi:MAG: hypothetical protein WDA25_01065 [Paracoccaceae bacterium]